TEAAQLRDGLADLGTKLVGVPLWADRLSGAGWASAIHAPQYLVNLGDGTIVAADAELENTSEYAPLLVGRLEQRPEIDAWTIDGGTCEIAVREDSPWDYRIGLNAATTTTFPVIDPDWTRVIDRSSDRLQYEEIGDGRERAVD